MQSDVKATQLSASGAVFASSGRVKAIHIVCGAAAGTVVIKDGGASGTSLLTIDTPAGVTESVTINIPENGIRCETDVYAVLTGVGFATVFYA